MAVTTEKKTNFYELANGYTVTHLEARDCNFIYRDKNQDIVALLEGCGKSLTKVNPYKGRPLNNQEKKILHLFIRKEGFRINAEVADFLEVSIIRYADDKEEYLSEPELKKRLAKRMECVALYVGRLQKHTLRLKQGTSSGIYNLANAKIKKLVVEANCNLHLDLRDNTEIESVRIGENYNGALNLSRSTAESVFLDNNCRCNISFSESRKCFNLIIADVYSGNLVINDSCFYGIKIGYYCYASINLAHNWGRRDIEIGDSFRGELRLDDVEVYRLRLGKDCKGTVTISNKDKKQGNREIRIADDFAGILNLQNAEGIKRLDVGSHARGRFNLLGNHGIKVAKFDKYFNGYANFSNSSVEYVRADYGSSGDFVFNECDNLVLLELPRYKNTKIITEKRPLEISGDSHHLYYRYRQRNLFDDYTPFYKKIYSNLKEIFS